MSKFSKGQVKVIRGFNINRSLEPLFNVFKREAKENERQRSAPICQFTHSVGSRSPTWVARIPRLEPSLLFRVYNGKKLESAGGSKNCTQTGSLTAIGTQFLYFFSVHLFPALSPLSPLFTSPYSVFLCFSLSLSFPPLSGPIHCDQGMKQQYKIQAFHRNHAFKVKA